MTPIERAFRKRFAAVYRRPEHNLELAVVVADYAVAHGWRHPMSSRFAWPKIEPPKWRHIRRQRQRRQKRERRA